MGNYIPRADAVFDVWQKNLMTHVVAKATAALFSDKKLCTTKKIVHWSFELTTNMEWRWGNMRFKKPESNGNKDFCYIFRQLRESIHPQPRQI